MSSRKGTIKEIEEIREKSRLTQNDGRLCVEIDDYDFNRLCHIIYSQQHDLKKYKQTYIGMATGIIFGFVLVIIKRLYL